ncbi:sigma-70 family RNA polymerase sigma factor [Cohnella faecalis]|uniref:Sigma-70 family RNA polymerase sigma factor n=2 Tax=Cohnella faecalis TaxID=2315694 RepID=A0A398CFC8_9BACL|nr:sigma-70 family RNA polymerase sigma factor [Cohnella faecalis]
MTANKEASSSPNVAVSANAPDSETLARMALSGDDEAFFRLVTDDRERLLRIAYAYMKNEHDALEAIQEATCRAYAKLRKLKEPSLFLTWYTRILINCCIDEQKRKRRMLPMLRLPEGAAIDRLPDERLRLDAAIAKLAPHYRHIIILKYYEDMTLTEIARLLEKPDGTVKTWLNKALKKLRADLGEGGGGFHDRWGEDGTLRI